MRVALLTISDSVFRGLRQDLSGPALRERCWQLGWEVVAAQVVADEEGFIAARLIELAESGLVDLILTTGGTGIGPRDVTPEATASVSARIILGISERMRALTGRNNPRAALSRGLAGVRGRTLIVNLPGSPPGAVESLGAVAELLAHALEVLHGAGHDSSTERAP